ncbi:MAG: helix-turn-helix transcriptional regulator [Bacteroidota bacterium]
MIKELKKFRKEGGYSKKGMAKKLGITMDLYKRVESGDETKIDSELRQKIKDLVSSKPKRKDKGSKSSSFKGTLTKPIASQLVNDKIRRILPKQNPIQDVLDKIHKPFTLQSPVYDIAQQLRPKLPCLEISKGVHDAMKSYEGLYTITDMFKPITSASAVASIINDQLDFYSSYDSVFLNDIVQPQSGVTKIIDEMRSTGLDYNWIQKTVFDNKKLYTDFIDLNSELTKTFIQTPALNFTHNADNFTVPSPKPFDLFSGTSFTYMVDDLQDIDEEILTVIQDDESLQEDVLEFYEELAEIIDESDSDYDVDLTRVEQVYAKIVTWAINSLGTALENAQIVATLFIKNYTFLIPMFAVVMSSNFNKDQSIRFANLEKAVTELTESMEAAKYRQAWEEVSLKSTYRDNSKTLGTVVKMQNVEVIQERRLWMKVRYEDFNTGEEKEGWVRKRFFDDINFRN